MTHDEYRRLQYKRGYQEKTRDELLEEKSRLEEYLKDLPADYPTRWWEDESLELINEVLDEESYAPEFDEADVENGFLIWGF